MFSGVIIYGNFTMFLTFKEIDEILSKLDKEYAGLRKKGTAHQQGVGSTSLFILRRVRKEVVKKFKNKYSK